MWETTRNQKGALTVLGDLNVRRRPKQSFVEVKKKFNYFNFHGYILAFKAYKSQIPLTSKSHVRAIRS